MSHSSPRDDPACPTEGQTSVWSGILGQLLPSDRVRGPSLVTSSGRSSTQDALRTRFAENQCKTVTSGENTKGQFKRLFGAFSPVSEPGRFRLLIRRLWVRVPPPEPPEPL